MKKSLEKVLVKPVIDEVMQKFLGVTIEELSNDLTDKIQHRPLISFDVKSNLTFKTAKKLFKKEFISRLIETNYGNISAVARICGLDRRSIHRTIQELGIDVKECREKMLKRDYYSREQVDNILKTTLNSYSSVIHPSKLREVYQNIDSVSNDIVKGLPLDNLTWKEASEEFEREYLAQALASCGHNISVTAKKIRLRYETLIRKMKKYGL